MLDILKTNGVYVYRSEIYDSQYGLWLMCLLIVK